MQSDTNAIVWEKHPELKNPLMIAAFEGWNDGGSASTNAVRRLVKTFDAERFARVDPEEFYVFSENRPSVKLLDGRMRRIDWQTNEFYHAHLPGTDQDVILFLGVEPNLRWRTYCSNLVAVAQHQNVSTVVTLGAYLADVLYTLPVQVTGFASDIGIEETFSLRRSNYEGPTGIVGVFTDYCRQHEMGTLSLWAAVPYYISIPNPKAVHSLLSKLRAIYGVELDLTSLEKDADTFDNEINDVVAKDPNVAAYVRELKKREFLN
ncbi:MAG TPA: PAC2 family protein [bacterium]|nr:PAC2 family protein [bacterium]